MSSFAPPRPVPTATTKPATTPQAQPAPGLKPASPLAMPAAQVLNTLRTAPTLKLGLQQLSEKMTSQFGLTPQMDLQAVVVVLTTKVGYGPLDQAYRRLTRHTLIQDFAPQLGSLTASRAGMQMNAAQHAGVVGAMLDQHDRTAWMVGNDAVDRSGKTDNLLPNILMGSTRQLGKPVVNIPGPVGAVLSRIRKAAPAAADLEVDRYSVIDDPRVIQALEAELRTARSKGYLPQFLTAFKQQQGQSLYTYLGETVRDATQRQTLLALLPAPISDAQLTFDAFLENVAIGMAYENAPGKALEGDLPFKDVRRGGQVAPLLAYFGYEASDVVAGKWGLELRILTPIPGKAKYKDVIVAWRGTEGIAFSLKGNKAGTVDTKIGDVAPGSIGYHQIMQNKEIIDHQLAKAREHGPLLMVGHSLGGGLAQLAATMYPQYTRTVVTFQGANIDQKDIDRLLAYNRANPELAVTARHYRADGDIVPTSGDAAVPGQIHYFDPQWKPQSSAQPFGSSVASRAMAGHNIPLLNTYLQGMRTNNPALNLLKAAGIQDEATQPQDKAGRKRTDLRDARVVYGGSYTTAKDPRLITEGARDNAVILQQKVTALLPFFDSPVGFREVITGELPTNTLLDHLVTQARKSASYQAFTANALKLMGLQDGTYGPLTLKVTAKDVSMAKDMGMKLPSTVTVPVEVLRAFIEPGELKRRTYRRLEVVWSNLKS